MLAVLLGLILSGPVLALKPAPGYASHPKPQTPKLIAANLLPELKKELVHPPKPGSETQKNDEMTLLKFQADRTAADCKRAEVEVQATLKNFYGLPYGGFSDEAIAALTPFFDQLRNDSAFYIMHLKEEYPRPRPFTYLKQLRPCVLKESSLSYPSGHAALAKIYGLVLADLFPQQREPILVRSETIASDRVLAGVHHPTDIEAGKQLGVVLYGKFKASAEYVRLFNAVKAKNVSPPQF